MIGAVSRDRDALVASPLGDSVDCCFNLDSSVLQRKLESLASISTTGHCVLKSQSTKLPPDQDASVLENSCDFPCSSHELVDTMTISRYREVE